MESDNNPTRPFCVPFGHHSVRGSRADLLKSRWRQERAPIAYGADSLHFGEPRVPAGKGPHPVVTIVHGGCRVAKLGNPNERAVGLDLLHSMAEELAKSRISTWNLEYRRLGNDRGDWPGTLWTSRVERITWG